MLLSYFTKQGSIETTVLLYKYMRRRNNSKIKIEKKIKEVNN